MSAYGMRISDWSSDVCSSDLAIGCRMIPAIEAQDRGWRAAYVEQKHGAVDGDQRHHLVVPTEQRAGQKSERRCDHPCGDRPCNIEEKTEFQQRLEIRCVFGIGDLRAIFDERLPAMKGDEAFEIGSAHV